MGEELVFPIVVRDDGTVVVNRFARGLTRSADVARRAGGRITKAFRSVGKGLRRLPGAIFSIRGALVALGGAAVIRAFQNVISAAAAQEDAVNRLNAALRTAGMFSEEVSESAQELASSLQAQTRFGDEAILAMQALLITYGVTADKLDEATRASLDFAAATGKDITTAALTVGKAAAGFTGELSRYGIIVDTKSIPASEVFTTVLAKLNDQFGGRAQADVETISGRLAQLGNLIGDVREKIGFAIINSQKFRDALADLTIGLVATNNALARPGTGLGDSVAAVIPSSSELVNKLFALLSAGARLRIVLLLLSQAVTFFAIGAVAIVAILEKLRTFIVTKMVGALNTLQATIAFAFQDLLDRLSLIFQRMGTRLVQFGIGTTALGNKLLDLAVDAGRAANSFEDFGKNVATQSTRLRAAEERIAFLRGVIGQLKRDFAGTNVEIDKQLDSLRRLNLRLEEAQAEVRKLSEEQKAAAATTQAAATVTRTTLGEIAAAFVLSQIPIQTALNELSAAGRLRLEQDVMFQQAAEDKKLDIIKKALKKEQALRRGTAAGNLKAAAQLAGGLTALAEASGQAGFKSLQKFRIGEAIINTAAGVANVLGDPRLGTFERFAFAAAVLAQGLAQVAAIRSARPGGGGGGAAIGAPGGGGGPGAPAAPAPVELAEAPGRPSIINITVDGFVGDQAEFASKVTEILREVQGDGGQLEVIT